MWRQSLAEPSGAPFSVTMSNLNLADALPRMRNVHFDIAEAVLEETELFTQRRYRRNHVGVIDRNDAGVSPKNRVTKSSDVM